MNDGSRARSSAASSDATSVRRIGEALLMAQNRARVSTERANRSERILRTVLSQINLQSGVLLHELEEYPRTMSFDSLEDWNLLRSLVEPPGNPELPTLRYPAPSPISTEQTSFALSMAHTFATPHTLASPPHSDATEDIRAVTRDIVMNLHVAARTADRRIEKLGPSAPPTQLSLHGWLARVLGMETYYYARPWQFMAGVVLGVALGVVATRRFLLERALQLPVTVSPTKYPSKALLMDQPALAASGTTPSSVSGMTCRGDALTKRQMTKLHLAASRLPVTFAMEDMSYLLHPPTEVS